MNAKIWIKSFFISSCIMMSFFAIVNYTIDPYDFFGSNLFNLSKTEQADKIRLVKVMRVNDIKPKSIILGTSRAAFGFNPLHKYFIQPAYNLGIDGSPMREIRLNFENALKTKKLKQVLLVVDYSSFTSKNSLGIDDFAEYFQGVNRYSYLFSIDTLKDSIFTLKGRSKNSALYLSNGQREQSHHQNGVINYGGHLAVMLNSESIYYKDVKPDYIYEDINQSSFDDFESILKDCAKNNIKLDIIFGPSHIRQWESFDYHLGYKIWLQWKKDVVLSVDKIQKESNKNIGRVFDFAIYHNLTAEIVPKNPKAIMKYHYENSHYKSELGDIVLDRLFGKSEYSDFGVELNISNIDEHLNNLPIERKKFIDSNKYKKEINNYINNVDEDEIEEIESELFLN